VTETIRHALNALATTHPKWLCAHTTAAWVNRYGLRASECRLPKGQEKRDVWAEQVGRDGQTLLSAVYTEPKGGALHTEPAGEMLRLLWVQNFKTVNERLRRSTNDETPPTGRYIGGQAKPHVAHLMAAAGTNIVRLRRWLAGEPKAQTRLSPFARLYQGAT
jgi:hypothetical protein